MKHKGIFLALLFGLLLQPGTLPGADEPPVPGITVEISVDRRVITVGDPVQVTLTIRAISGFVVSPVPIRGQVGVFSVGEVSGPERRARVQGGEEIVYRFDVTAFRTGQFTLPAIPVRATRIDTGAETVGASSPVEISVSSVLTDASREPADIKNPVFLAAGWGVWLWSLLLLGGVAGLLVYLRWFRKRKHMEPILDVKHQVPADEWAFTRLRALLDSDRLRRGEMKEFFIELSEIHKGYLNRRFQILTLERTTDEVIGSLRFARVGVNVVQGSRSLLSRCDLVKFARHVPAEETIRKLIDLAYRFIDETHLPAAAMHKTLLGGPDRPLRAVPTSGGKR